MVGGGGWGEFDSGGQREDGEDGSCRRVHRVWTGWERGTQELYGGTMRWGEVAKVVQWEERHMGRTAVGGGKCQYEDYLSLVLDSSSAARIYTYR